MHGGEAPQPTGHGGGVVDAILSLHAIADRDRDPPLAFGHAKASLVGEVVADEYRPPARERRLVHKFLDGGSLVEAARHYLQDHVAFLDVKGAAERCGDGVKRLANTRFVARRHAKVHRDGAAFVLDEGAPMSRGERLYRHTYPVEPGINEVRALHSARRLAPLDAVQSRRRQPQRIE